MGGGGGLLKQAVRVAYWKVRHLLKKHVPLHLLRPSC